ncbi:hypothetical protein HDV06_003753 [Boothiomyces sp. JEL0866]|nr:hypothetical protein HDV06_003753 [Boothiomyces sp. JEL0866]
MFSILSGFCYLFGSSFCSTLVSLDYGTFRGISDASTVSFLNIPYAKPPVGQLRFAPPQEPDYLSGIQDATTFGSGCVQNPISGGNNGTNLVISEDCLNLNVYKSTQSKRLVPVVVYVVGGGFNSGYAANPYYDGKSILSNIQSDLVIVTFNYRVGAFGFLSSKELQSKGFLNPGLLDQVMVFKWVKKYISLFGGDPNQITAFGQSAGAISIGTLLTTSDLFDQAIMHSGGPPYLLKQPADNQQYFESIASTLKCNNNTVACLQQVDPLELYLATQSFQFFPVLDGSLIHEQPLSKMLSGRFKQMPVMLNNVLDEGNIFMQPVVKSPAYVTLVEKQVFFFLNSSSIGQLQTIYPPNASFSFQSVGDAYGDLGFQCPTLLVADMLKQQQVYKSVFTHQSVYLPAPPGVGIAHGSDIPFTWYYEPKLTDNEKKIARFIGTSWTDFVLGKLDWPAYNGTMVDINTNITQTLDNSRISKCEFWQTVV